MKYIVRYLALAVALGLVAFGCSEEPELLQTAPSGLLKSALDGTETLGDFPVAAGTGIVAKGIGMQGGTTGTITFSATDVPAGVTVEEVILYWEGHHTTPNGDADITVNGGPVTGTLIGGPTEFYPSGGLTYRSSSYRAVLSNTVITPGVVSNVALAGFDMAKNNGAGILVIYDDGAGPSTIAVKDGNDLAWAGFDVSDPRRACVEQTFTFPAATVARSVSLVLFASSVQAPRPNELIVLIDGSPAPGYPVCPAFGDNANPEWDTYSDALTIPAGATSVTVQPVSRDCNASGLNPASIAWVCAAAAIPVELASIGDFVWLDTNHDGIQDPGENGISGVTVRLYECGGTTPIATTTTNATGYYLFDDLTPGQYFVEFVPPAGHIVSPKDQGADDAKDSDADPTTGRTVCTTLDPGENDMTWDAGMYTLASIGDFVWLDTNRNGIQDPGENGISGVTVRLYECGGTTPIATKTTSATGYYLFDGLTPDDYFVEFVLPANHVFTLKDQGADDAKDSDADGTTGRTICTTLDPGENDMTWDAGMYIPYASIGDFVWADTNRDGIQDPGEIGIPGVTVYLFECGASTPMATTATDANGYYLFDNLLPGQYSLMFLLVSGLKFSPQDVGANDAVDSDALETSGATVCTLLDADENDMTWDAGMHEPVPFIFCRMTGGGNGEAEETHPDRMGNGPNMNVYTCGGQAGAPTARQPQPKGEWTHTQKRGPAGSFTFHAGTASAPPGTEIDWIQCTDPGWCRQARKAPAKQLDFAGVGTFHNMKNCPPSIADYVTVDESLHWFEVNVDDLGEPGKAGKQPPPAAECDPLGFGRNGGEELANCDCPDFYRIRIYTGPDENSIIMYEAYGYIEGGNFQLHPPTGRDLKDFEDNTGAGGRRK